MGIRTRVGPVPLVEDAARTLAVRPLRALAMVAGVVVGVAAGAFTLVFTASEQAEVTAGFDRQLSPVVVVEAVGGTAAGAGPAFGGPAEEVEAVIRGAPGVLSGGELTTWRREALVAVNDFVEPEVAPVFGVSPGGLEAAGVQLVEGLEPGALLDGSSVAWVGEQLAAELGIDLRSSAGQVVVVDGIHLTVAGVTSDAVRYPALGRAVLLAAPVAAGHWPDAEQPRVVAHVRRGAAPPARDHLLVALDPRGVAQLRDMTPPDGGALRDEVNADVRRAGYALSGIALGIGMISVANVLSITVLERTREFGVRSALGWPVTRLARLVMTEAALAGTVATLVGAALGVTLAGVVCRINGWETILPPTALWAPALGGLVAALTGGIAPAVRAGLVDPVDALRS